MLWNWRGDGKKRMQPLKGSCLLLAAFAIVGFAADAPKPVPAGSRIYVAPEGGFDTFLVAALQKKKVPVTVVADKDKADFILEGTSESQKAGWAKTIFLKQSGSDEEASSVARTAP